MNGKSSKKYHKKHRLRTYLIDICAVIILACMCWYTFVLHESGKAETSVSEDEAPFELTMLDVGQGLSILIEADGEYLLYDGGGYDTAADVVDYLKGRGIRKFRYIIASHYDMDHIGGLLSVFGAFPVDTVLCADYDADTGSYRAFTRKAAASASHMLSPLAGDSFSLGSAEFQVVSPSYYDHPAENNNSIAIRVSYGSSSAIITGDAEYVAEQEMLSSGYTLASTVYVVGHHGSSSSSSAAFVEAVSPDYALISVGAGNDFGHPTEWTLDTLDEAGCRLFRTDKQGVVIFRSDGESCWFNVAPCDDWSPGS